MTALSWSALVIGAALTLLLFAAVHPPGSSPGRVHSRAEPPARPRGRGSLARDRASAAVRIGGALEAGRFSVNVRLLADPADRRYLTGLLHQVILVALAATSGVMAVLMLGLHGGPAITKTVTLYAFFGYCLLVVAAILALRVLVLVFRPDIR
jgi:hypothetical protein